MKRAILLSSAVAVALGATTYAALARDGGDKGAKFFQEADANADGFLTRAEMDAFSKARFDGIDANSDGLLSVEELAAHAEGKASKRAGKRSAKMLKHKDANGDGQLSFEEMQAGRDGGSRTDRMFEHLDANKDGALSVEEMAEAGKGMRKKFRKSGGDASPKE